MEITGTLIHLLTAQTGNGKNGPWKKQDFVIETGDTYPKKVCLATWGDKIDLSKLSIGQQLKVNFDVESREYNGKWYTDLKAFNIQPLSKAANTDTPGDAPFPPPGDMDDDLPF